MWVLANGILNCLLKKIAEHQVAVVQAEINNLSRTLTVNKDLERKGYLDAQSKVLKI